LRIWGQSNTKKKAIPFMSSNNTFYCPHCFAKSEYRFSKPNFCPSCGKGATVEARATVVSPAPQTSPVTKVENDKISRLERELEELKRANASARGVARATTRGARRRPDPYIDDADDFSDDNESDYVPGDIPILEAGEGIKIEGGDKARGMTLGAVVETAAASGKPDAPFKRNMPKKSKKAILEELRRESSFGGRNNPIEID
jgi:uncharacterized Zn finger protein (UPF0148 family)